MRPSLLYTVEERVQHFLDWGGKCFYCDKKLPKPGTRAGRATHFDHLVPQSRGGTDDLSNLRPCCKRCNTDKADMHYIDFLERNHAKALEQVNRLASLLFEARRDPFWDDDESQK